MISEMIANAMRHKCVTLRMADFDPATSEVPVGEVLHEIPVGWRLMKWGQAEPVFVAGTKVQSWFYEREPGLWFSPDWGVAEGIERAVQHLEALRAVLTDNAAASIKFNKAIAK
jgi:hypothetical protein